MAGYNKIVREVAPKSLFPSAQALIDSTTSWAQGDLIVLDITTHKLKKAALETDSANFQGIAVQTIVSGKVASPYNTDVVASQAITDIAGPMVGVVAKVVLKTGDALNAGAPVYLDPASGSRNVQSLGTTIVGYYQGATIASATAGQEIEVMLGLAFIGNNPAI